MKRFTREGNIDALVKIQDKLKEDISRIAVGGYGPNMTKWKNFCKTNNITRHTLPM